jgi:hypothetical protein
MEREAWVSYRKLTTTLAQLLEASATRTRVTINEKDKTRSLLTDCHFCFRRWNNAQTGSSPEPDERMTSPSRMTEKSEPSDPAIGGF